MQMNQAQRRREEKKSTSQKLPEKRSPNKIKQNHPRLMILGYSTIQGISRAFFVPFIGLSHFILIPLFHFSPSSPSSSSSFVYLHPINSLFTRSINKKKKKKETDESEHVKSPSQQEQPKHPRLSKGYQGYRSVFCV